MSTYTDYLEEINNRKKHGLNPKPIDDSELTKEITSIIKNKDNNNRKDALKFFIYNTLPGTTGAAKIKAKFLKDIIIGDVFVEEINQVFAFELLSHMKGGPSVQALLDLAFGENDEIAKK